MTHNKSFIDELNKVAELALSSATHIKDNIIEFAKENVELMREPRSYVSRDEFEALKKMVLDLQAKFREPERKSKRKKAE